MGVGVAIDLVGHEAAEDGDRERIGPELVEPEEDDQGGFYYAVGEEIERGEDGIGVADFVG